MDEVNAECEKILKERLEAIKMEEEAEKLKLKSKFKTKKPKNIQPVQPRKLRVIKPPPEPKIVCICLGYSFYIIEALE